jgi:hypothetical protein
MKVSMMAGVTGFNMYTLVLFRVIKIRLKVVINVFILANFNLPKDCICSKLKF